MSTSTKNSFHHMLHMGCDQKYIKNIAPYYQTQWRETRLDVMPNCNPDIICDVLDMAHLPSKAYQSIYSSHNIEHVYQYQTRSVLSEMRRMLDDGGFAFIRTPDMQAVAKVFAEQGPNAVLYKSPAGPITAHDTFYGKDTILESGHHFMAHKCGFSAQTMLDSLKAAGFGSAFVMRSHYELLALGFTHALDQKMFSFEGFDLKAGFPQWIDDYFYHHQT